MYYDAAASKYINQVLQKEPEFEALTYNHLFTSRNTILPKDWSLHSRPKVGPYKLLCTALRWMGT
jgi:hypothetical protein